MGRRDRVWLCGLGLAYAFTSSLLLYVYEFYFRSYVIGGGQEKFEVNHGPKIQRRVAATDQQQHVKLKHRPRPMHTCILHDKTITLPKAPSLILAGAMKSGTSYFWALLRNHPDFIPTKKFEAHFFDWNFAVPPNELKEPSFWQRFENATTEEEYLCAARKQYIIETFSGTSVLDPNERRLAYEKTPNYMFLPSVPELIHKICPWTKIVLILRNPVDRAYSHYIMDSLKQRAAKPFEEYIQLELQTLWMLRLSKLPPIRVSEWSSLDESKEHLFEIPNHNMTEEEELHANWMVYRQRHMQNYLQRGIYSVQLERWKKYFPLGESLMVINNERLNQEPRKVMTEVLRWLGVPRKDYFTNPNVSVSFEFEAEENDVVRNITLPRKTFGLSNLLSVSRYDPMSATTRRFLEKFYKPYNAELGRILGEDWDGVWGLE